MCAVGYFEQFGNCVVCPSASGASAGQLVGILLLLLALCGALFAVRALLPVDLLKLGLSMLQIIASASTAYTIPWPPAFTSFLSVLRVFLVDVVSITRTNCAQPLDYYASMTVVLVGVKVLLLLLLAGPAIWVRCRRRRWCDRLNVRAVQRQVLTSSFLAGQCLIDAESRSLGVSDCLSPHTCGRACERVHVSLYAQ